MAVVRDAMVVKEDGNEEQGLVVSKGSQCKTGRNHSSRMLGERQHEIEQRS